MSHPQPLMSLQLRTAVPWVMLAVVAAFIARADQPESALVFAIMMSALAGGLYLHATWLVLRRRRASVERGQLTVRDSGERVVGSVSLHERFAATCIHYDGEWALYRVAQGRTVVRFAVPRHSSGEVVKALKLPWPPSSTHYGAWVR
jgi:hypothetical protein